MRNATNVTTQTQQSTTKNVRTRSGNNDNAANSKFEIRREREEVKRLLAREKCGTARTGSDVADRKRNKRKKYEMGGVAKE
jgi:hypothetical protein